MQIPNVQRKIKIVNIMKTPVSNLPQALAHQLKGLYDAEKKLLKALPVCSKGITSSVLRNEVVRYAANGEDRLIKLERIFNFLVEEPEGIRNHIIEQLIDETHVMLKQTAPGLVGDVMFISCVQNIVHYKITGYRTALVVAEELQLDPVPDLLLQILEWEKETDLALSKISVEEMNLKPHAHEKAAKRLMGV